MKGVVQLEVRCGLCADEKRPKNLLAQVVAIDGELWWHQSGSVRPTPRGIDSGLVRGSARSSGPARKLDLSEESIGYAVLCDRHPVVAAWSSQIRDALRANGTLWLR